MVGALTRQSTASGSVRLQRHRSEDEQYELRLWADTGLELNTDSCTAALSLSRLSDFSLVISTLAVSVQFSY